jgi:hypothetical protein
MKVNATGLTHCDDPETQVCEDRSNHPEEYCIKYEEDEWCDQVDICDDEGEITSKDLFCTGEAVSYDAYEGCPEGYHEEEDDESGQCYRNDVPCREGMITTDENDCRAKYSFCPSRSDHSDCKEFLRRKSN